MIKNSSQHEVSYRKTQKTAKRFNEDQYVMKKKNILKNMNS